MLRYQFFPRSHGLIPRMKFVVDAFNEHYDEIASEKFNLKSDEVLQIVRPSLEKLGFRVEAGKGKDDKIYVPVLFGENNQIDKSFYADAVSDDGKIAIEVEAGRATENNQFLKDIFQACMMFEVEYLVIAVRLQYRNHMDFEIIHTFLETMYISNRMQLPLKGILLIGY